MKAFTDWRILILLLIPLALSVVFLMRRKENHWRYSDDARDFQWWEALLSLALYAVIVSPMWYLGRNARIGNYKEQIGGFVAAMHTQDGDHERSYECNCYTDSDGDRHCSTCYETIYHREYFIDYDIGDWFSGNHWYDRVDKPCDGCDVYHVPERYTKSYVGKAVSFDNYYKNYIAAMNEDVYRVTYKGLAATMPDICPDTPDIRADEQSVHKAFPIGFNKDDPLRSTIYSWNFAPGDNTSYMTDRRLENVPLYTDTLFGYLGKEVQGDIHLYVVNSTNPQYAPMCLAKWRNGAKNSIYVFLFGLQGSEYFQVTDIYVGVGVDGTDKNTGLASGHQGEDNNYYLKFDTRNQLLDYFSTGGTLDREKVLRIISDNVNAKFVRQEMAKNEALKEFVKPTTGWIWLIGILLLIVEGTAQFLLANNNI